MKRFLSTTAVLLTMSGAAYADAHTNAFGAVTFQEGDFFASDLIGMRIYNSETEVDENMMIADGGEQEWDDIGEINDIIVSQDGEVTAVILGIGGFLGIGERDVAIDMDSIRIVREEGDSNDRFLVVSTSQEMLEQAPEFERNMNADVDMNTDANVDANADATVTTTTTAVTDTAENIEAETEEMAAEVEAETTELAAEAEAETEQMAAEVEAETEQMAAEAEAETEEMAAEVEAEVEADTTVGGTAATGGATLTTDMDRPLLTRPLVERDGYQEVDAAMVRQMTADDLENARIYGVNDEDIGEIEELLVNDNGEIDRVLIDVGGFLGMGERRVAVSFEELQVLRNAEGNDVRIYIDSTEEALESLPEYQG
ncbi:MULTISPECIES: PRC-barrel domain-containing protein [unclassified Sulfitobacter]|uniref:PRC-barrel domain-containing protein n=1 Tax=unclassified Sulfitobacter TaxID=196795 RepID=UPI0007C3EA31|nr:MULTISPECIES: PRC-barrel domain-containing protein [unclassified Sulfitobacter]KZY06155.1 photosystem reaction center subunit H [Sulfitobacter sp. HI0023]KZY27550.1 photosystem reaction center subunit H [Sulfitobacter sp. HI0040]KZZ69959.1 photosystem reaction center subunit H [Sulfitobacter sp. HI0129]